MDVSENSGTPKSSILIRFSIINHPFWSTPIFGNTHITVNNQGFEHCSQLFILGFLGNVHQKTATTNMTQIGALQLSPSPKLRRLIYQPCGF